MTKPNMNDTEAALHVKLGGQFTLKPEHHARWMQDKEPDPFDGRYDSPAARLQLTMSDKSDYLLANEQFLCMRSDLNLIAYQTAAKERIRFLSRQLYLANNQKSDLMALLSVLTSTTAPRSITIELSNEEDELDLEKVIGSISQAWLNKSFGGVSLPTPEDSTPKEANSNLINEELLVEIKNDWVNGNIQNVDEYFDKLKEKIMNNAGFITSEQLKTMADDFEIRINPRSKKEDIAANALPFATIHIFNKELEGINPNDPDLSDEVKLAIFEECRINPVYFYCLIKNQ